MICPFCKNKLASYVGGYYTGYECVKSDCMINGMPRYKINCCSESHRVIDQKFMIDQYYIEIDHDNQITQISLLNYAFLFDTFVVHRALSVDFNNLEAFVEKIKIYSLFS